MKANKAPEKIYFTSTEDGTHYYTEGIPFEREYIEYARTDAFIEKACEYWYKYNRDVVNKRCCGFTVNVEDFRKYMEDKK